MRQPRKIRIGGIYHVVARANRREFILREAHVKRMFLETVRRAKDRHSFRIINMCVMDNHFHLMIEPARDESLSKIMQWILSVFARRFNRAYSLQGHVWYDRFKSRIVSSLRQFIATFAYIDENPVRAELVARSADYPYGGQAFIRAGPAKLVDRPSRLVKLLFPRFDRARLPVPIRWGETSRSLPVSSSGHVPAGAAPRLRRTTETERWPSLRTARSRVAGGVGLSAAIRLPPGFRFDPSCPPGRSVAGFRSPRHAFLRFAFVRARSSPALASTGPCLFIPGDDIEMILR